VMSSMYEALSVIPLVVSDCVDERVAVVSSRRPLSRSTCDHKASETDQLARLLTRRIIYTLY